MRNKIISLLATGLALAACECSPDHSVNVGQAGCPGSPEDFKNNIKDRVFFGFDSSHITEKSRNTLEAQAGWLKTYSSTKAVIAGHCDVRGTREYNLALGERRANAAKMTLSSMGVDSNRLRTISYGKDSPLVHGHSEEAHAQNRAAVTSIE